MADLEDEAFDKIMEIVGNDGKFQKRFNWLFNVGLVMCVSMSYMNIIMALSEPKHHCQVPGRERYNLTVDEWKNLTLPRETDNRGEIVQSSCKMYNITSFLGRDHTTWNLTASDITACMDYEYDRTWYGSTAVTDEDWVCDKELYQTNTFVFNRIGEVVGTCIFGQLGDTLGRRPIFYISTVIIIIGRLMSTVTSSVYYLFAIASVIGMLTSMSSFMAPLIIAMEISKEADRALIAMLQCVGWTIGMCIMPLVFWAVRDWKYFLILTTIPCAFFAMIPKYMIESPRWLVTKKKFKRAARELNKIARINDKHGVKITEKFLEEQMPNVTLEKVYGMASLFSGWRLAKNTSLIITNWIVTSISYFVLVLILGTRMEGNPFLNFLVQSAVELPAYLLGRLLSDKIGRRYTNAISYLMAFLTCLPILLLIKHVEYENFSMMLGVLVKLCISITFFVVNLQSMEIYPTCLRQTGISIGSIVANSLGVSGPYIVYLGAYDVRYPFMVLCAMALIGTIASIFLPETLHHKLPNTLAEAKSFGKEQVFWSLPKQPKSNDESLEALKPQNNIP